MFLERRGPENDHFLLPYSIVNNYNWLTFDCSCLFPVLNSTIANVNSNALASEAALNASIIANNKTGQAAITGICICWPVIVEA